MSGQEVIAYPSVKLSLLLNTLENGSRPSGGVGLANKGIPSLGGEHIANNGKFNFKNVRFVSEDFFARMSRGIVQKYDVLVVKDGATTGKTAFVDDEFPYENAAINEHVFILRPDRELLLPEYLFFFLYSAWGQAQIKREFHGAAIGGINQSFADHFDIPLPPLPEQRRIAAILRQADALRQWRRDANDSAKRLAASVFEKIFDYTTNDWENIKLVDLCGNSDDIKCGPFGTQLKRNEYQDHGVPLWSIPHVNQHFNIPTSEFLSHQKANELNSYSLLPGDIVMTRKATIGNCTIYPDNFEKGIMHSDLLRIRVDRNKCIPEYLFGELAFGFNVANQINALAAGAVTKGINVGKLKQISVRIPPMSLQIKFAEKLLKIRELENTSRESQAKLNGLMMSITTRAFTGELTESWREGREDELKRAAAKRDRVLRQRNRLKDEQAGITGNITIHITPENEEDFANFPKDLEKIRLTLGNIGVQLAKNLSDNYKFQIPQISERLTEIGKVLAKNYLERTAIYTAGALRESINAMLQAILRSTSPSADPEVFWNNIDSLPTPHENRAVVAELDLVTLRVLKRAGVYPAYFTAEDLETGQVEGGISTPQAEACLRVLRALGIVRLVQIDGALCYRLSQETDTTTA